MPSFVRYYGSTSASNVSTITLSSFTVTAGNTGAIFFFLAHSSTPNFAERLTAGIFTDTLGNKWVAVPGSESFNANIASGNVNQGWILIGNIVNGGTASLTITFLGTSVGVYISGSEYSGTLSTFDKMLSTSGSGDPANPPSATIVTSQANELVLYFAACTATGVGSGWTSQGSTGNATAFAGYQVAGAAGSSVQATVTTTVHSQQYLFGMLSLYQTAPGTTVPYLNVDYGRNNSTGNVSSIAISSAVMTAGNLGILSVAVTGTSSITFTVADTLGNTWSPISNTYQSGTGGGAQSSQMFYCKITNSGTTTITVTFSGTGFYALVSAVEFASVGFSIEQTASSFLASTASPSTTMTPSKVGELCIGQFIANNGGFTGPSSGSAGFGIAEGAKFSQFDSWFGYFISTSSGSSLTMAGTSSSATTWTVATAGFYSADTDKAASADCYVFPWYGSRVASGDAWIVTPQVKASGDAYIVNPSNIHVLVSPVNLAGNILFKIDPISGYVRLTATIATALRTYVNLVATIKSTRNFTFINLGAKIQVGVRNYVRLIGTIQNPMTRVAFGDAVIASGYTRVYAILRATIVQKVGPGVGAGGSGGAQGKGMYPAQSYVKLGAWVINPRGGIP